MVMLMSRTLLTRLIFDGHLLSGDVAETNGPIIWQRIIQLNTITFDVRRLFWNSTFLTVVKFKLGDSYARLTSHGVKQIIFVAL